MSQVTVNHTEHTGIAYTGVLPRHCCCVYEGEADTLNRIIGLSNSISDETSAEYTHRKRVDLEGILKASDAEVRAWSINPSIHQSINKSINQPTKKPTSQPASCSCCLHCLVAPGGAAACWVPGVMGLARSTPPALTMLCFRCSFGFSPCCVIALSQSNVIVSLGHHQVVCSVPSCRLPPVFLTCVLCCVAVRPRCCCGSWRTSQPSWQQQPGSMLTRAKACTHAPSSW